MSHLTVVQPDLLFVSRERRQIINLPYIEGPPDLVVEVISPSSAKIDRGMKQQLYARHGVPNYWQFDPDAQQARAYVLERDGYREVLVARADDLFAAPPFPDLAIPLSELWD